MLVYQAGYPFPDGAPGSAGGSSSALHRFATAVRMAAFQGLTQSSSGYDVCMCPCISVSVYVYVYVYLYIWISVDQCRSVYLYIYIYVSRWESINTVVWADAHPFTSYFVPQPGH